MPAAVPRLAPPLLALLLAGGAAPDPADAPPPQLGFPLACTLGRDCLVQTYIDDDPSGGVRDYQCHGRTYAGHDGVDMRLKTLAQQQAGVAVLAAAAGTVTRARDGVADVSVRTTAPGSVAGRECGNGLAIDHGGGWETQYCHMAQGSLVVRPGQTVAAGTPIGRVGLSGNTEYPHLHLTLRHDGKAVDPFAFGAAPGSCGGGRSLWRAQSGMTAAYRRGEVLNSGFATAPVTLDQATARGSDQQPRPTRDGPALVAFVQAIGLEAGDVQRLTLTAPDGSMLADNRAAPLDHDKAQYILFTGKRRPAAGWPAGTYRARYGVQRAGRPALSAEFAITL